MAEFKLPNGVRIGGELFRNVELRKLKGRDEDFLRDKSNIREGAVMAKLVKGAITKLGPLVPGSNAEDNERFNIAFDRMFQADLTYLLIMLRVTTLGGIYRFSVSCPVCEAKSQQSIDMLAELKIDEIAEEYADLDSYTATVDGKSILFDALRVKHFSRLEAIQRDKKNEISSSELVVQLKAIDGEQVTMESVKELDWGFRNDIRTKMDEFSGGIDTNLEIECPTCGTEFIRLMPLESGSFFFPKGTASPKTRQAKSSRNSGTTLRSWLQDGAGLIKT